MAELETHRTASDVELLLARGPGDLLRARGQGRVLRRPSHGGRLRLQRRRDDRERRRPERRCASATPPRRDAPPASTARHACCGDAAVITERAAATRSAMRLYAREDRDALPDAAQLASLGCGNPTAVADLHEGETVLDLGSGGGIDVLLSARRVGPTGKAYGLDMTDEMLELARAQPARGRRRERRVPQGHDRGRPAPRRLGRRDHLQLRDQPLRRQAARLPRGGAGAAARRPLRGQRRRRRPGHGRGDPRRHAAVDRLHRRGADPRGLRARADAAGFEDVEIRETHRVHDQAASAIVRAHGSPR